MRILIDTSPLLNANAIRGVGVYTRHLLAELQKNPQIEIFATSDLPPHQKVDVVHYPFFDLFFATLPFTRPAPTVVTIHDVIPLVFDKFYRPGLKGWLRFWRQYLALRTVAAVITDSQASKQDIVKYLHLPAEKVHVTYLAANPNLGLASIEQIAKVRDRYHLPEEYLLYVGDINYNKNLPQLIKALKYLPDQLHLVCVGKNFRPQAIPEWQAIETQIALSNVASRITFLTEIKGDADQELSAIYSGAVAYVQPSLYEGFGLPVLEALRCEVPVVCSQNSSLIEVGGEHVIYAGTEAERIAEAVKEIYDWTSEQRATKVKQAKRWSEHFSWHKTAQETLEVYQQVSKIN